jgi:hypothetical protein
VFGLRYGTNSSKFGYEPGPEYLYLWFQDWTQTRAHQVGSVWVSELMGIFTILNKIQYDLLWKARIS